MTDLFDVHNARFMQPTEADMDTFLKEQFKVDTNTPHDPNDAAAVSAALLEPFPPEAIFKDDKGMSYVKYQQVVRRLIRATGNRFDVDVLDQRITPHGQTKSGVEKFLILATVKLTIPVLQSSRTQIGVQVAMANTEDLFKGAVSDGIKKCAQSFGVAIELAGDDRELANVHALHAPEPDRPPARISEKRAQQAAPVSDADYMAGQGQAEPAPRRQFAPAEPGTGGPASQSQKGRLWHMSGKDDTKVAAWAAEYGETLDTLTKGTASLLIDTKG
jgi:hypothetical protein